MLIPSLPDLVTGDVEWRTPEPARVYLNEPENRRKRIEVVDMGLET